MLEKLMQTAIQSNGGIEVYTHETMPERYHFSSNYIFAELFFLYNVMENYLTILFIYYTDNPRVAPIYVVPKLGWVVSDKVEHLEIMKGDYRPRGNHGYDPEDPEMHAIVCSLVFIS